MISKDGIVLFDHVTFFSRWLGKLQRASIVSYATHHILGHFYMVFVLGHCIFPDRA